MRRHLFAYLAPFLLIFGCGSNAAIETPIASKVTPDSTPADPKIIRAGDDAKSSNTFAVAQAGLGFTPTSAIFFAGSFDLGSPTPVVLLVQTDAPDLCAHYRAGTHPAGHNMFAIAFIQQDGLPVAAGRIYPAEPNDFFALGQLRRLNAQCEASPTFEDGQSRSGHATIHEMLEKRRLVGEYAFKLGDAGTPVVGAFDATYCDAPRLFDDVTQLSEPSVSPENCVTTVDLESSASVED